jgi:hypothetical protein
MPDGPYAVKFTMYDAEAGGNALWTETLGVTQAGGLFTTFLGSVTPFPTDLFAGGDRWLGIKVANDPEMAQRFRLTPSPWAIQAKNADTVDSIHASVAPTPSYLLPLDATGKFPSSVIPPDDDWTISGGNIYRLTGNVGIGKSSPTAPLDIQGTVKVTGFQLTTGAANGYVLTSDAAGVGAWKAADAANAWLLTGNAGTNPAINFVGTTDNQPLILGTNGTEAMRVLANGNVALGVNLASDKLEVVTLSGSAIRAFSNIGSGSVYGVYGKAQSTSGTGVIGICDAASGLTYGVYGLSASPSGYGGYFTSPGIGLKASSSGSGPAFKAECSAGDGIDGWTNQLDKSGVYGHSAVGYGVTGVGGAQAGVAGRSATGPGIYGSSASGHAGLFDGSVVVNGNLGAGTDNPTSRLTVVSDAPSSPTISATHTATYDDAPAISGTHNATDYYGIGVYGVGGYEGIVGEVAPVGANFYVGAGGFVHGGSGDNYGLYGSAAGGRTTYGVYAQASGGSGANYAGYFAGDVVVTGKLTKGSGSFTIDHPLDPENKYLSHSFVESPDMKDVYDGVVTTDWRGYATVTLPDWFEALNRDFRYQLTVLDDGDTNEFVLAKIVREIEGNRFVIRTSAACVKVSWQVTGIRQDPYANLHRIRVEEDKPASERGRYLHPDAYGQPEEYGIGFVKRREPEACKR